MITINNITMGFPQRTLFKDVSLSIFPNEKIGLTGPNGAGKTTLYSIILGETEPIAGNIQIQKNINIGYLPQEAKFKSEKTVMEELTEGDGRIKYPYSHFYANSIQAHQDKSLNSPFEYRQYYQLFH